jgi:hypothetical protein
MFERKRRQHAIRTVETLTHQFFEAHPKSKGVPTAGVPGRSGEVLCALALPSRLTRDKSFSIPGTISNGVARFSLCAPHLRPLFRGKYRNGLHILDLPSREPAIAIKTELSDTTHSYLDRLWHGHAARHEASAAILDPPAEHPQNRWAGAGDAVRKCTEKERFKVRNRA